MSQIGVLGQCMGGTLGARWAWRQYSRLEFVSGRSTANRENHFEPRVPPQPFQVDGPRALAGNSSDDMELARAGMLGEEWAQRQIWYRFAPAVHTFLRRALTRATDHEDLLQEVFLRVFRRLDTLRNPAALRAFIYSFAVRIVQEEVRRHRIRSRFVALFAPKCEASVPHIDFESRELLFRAEAALDSMTGRKRAVFVLRRFEGMELAAIATQMGLSVATVKRDLEDANRMLARRIRRDDALRSGLEAKVAGACDGGAQGGASKREQR